MLKFHLCLGPSIGRSPVSFITEILYALTVHPPCDFDFSDLWYQTINIVQKKTEFGTVLSPSLRISYIVAVFE
jgi:hypothetical protein